MKRLTILFTLLVFTCLQVFSQANVVTGTVTSVEDGTSLPGVSVVVRGTTIGTITDVDGIYSLAVPENAIKLMFTFVGMKTVEETIGGRSVIDVTLEMDILGLEEVVVTSLGITRVKKALGYSVQDVGGDELITARESNIINSLQGKLAGVQITNSDGGVAAGVRIIIRGMSTFGGNNQPLWVVDGVPISNSYSQPGAYGGLDYGNAAMDLNPSDIETISVLKGANAAALYGSRAVNGVVLVTTKSGKPKLGARRGLGITLETNWMWENVLVMPEYQNSYGQGSGGQFEYVDGAYGGTQDGVDESWGPPLDTGLMIQQWDSPYNHETGVRTATPWVSQPDNVKDFFVTGLTRTTNLALSGADNKASFRLSLSNQDVTGIMPSTDLRKNTVSVNAGLNVSDKLNVGGSVNYISNKSDNIVEGGYGGGNPMQSLGQWFGRQVDIHELEARWQEIDPVTKYPMNWNHSYHDNPYFVLNKNTNSRDRDRIIGNFNLQYQFTDWLSLKAMVGSDFYVEDRKQKTAHGTNGDRLGGYSSSSRRRNELTANTMLTMNRDFGTDINIIGVIGSEYIHYDYQYHSTGIADLIIPDLYATSNAAVQATTGLSETHTELQSVFGTLNFGFRNFLFVDLTARNDWSSTLPIENNSYFYPSVSFGLVVTEALGLQSDILSYAKVRASYAEVGGSAGAYQLMGTYGAAQPFRMQPSLSYTSTIPPLGLLPQKKKSIEFGAEFKFMNNRLALDATYYKENTINQIMSIAISRMTGFSSKKINAGNLQNSGVELTLRGTPIQTTDFRWDITANWSANENKVIELFEDMKYLYLYNGSWNMQVHARPGEEYGILWGYALEREHAERVLNDDGSLDYIKWSGRPLLTTSGRYRGSNSRTILGSVYPDWFGSVNNAISFKDVNFSVLIDFRQGGDMYSITDWFGCYAGVMAKTAAINDKGNNIREDPASGGGIKVEGVYGNADGDGNITFYDASGTESASAVENTTYSSAAGFYHNYWGKNEVSVFDASFVKLREVILGYTLRDVPFLTNIGIGSINFSLVGRNLAILHSNIPNIDPEYNMGAGNYVGMETNAIPSTRSYGFNLKVNF